MDKNKPDFTNISLGMELCEFIGIIIGDGCIDGYKTKNNIFKYHISISGHSDLDKDYLTNKIPNMIYKLFHKKVNWLYKKDTNSIVINIYSKDIFNLLVNRFEFKPGKKTYTTKIPQEIISSKKDYIFATIRGIFDTDGNVFIDKRKMYKNGYPRITLKIASKPLFNQVNKILKQDFSVYTAIKIDPENRQYYELVIYGSEQLKKWMKLIRFSNKKHLKKVLSLSGD